MAVVKVHISKSTINTLPVIGDRKRPIPCVAWDPANQTPDLPINVWDDEQPGFLLLCMPGGSRTFYLQARARDGRQFRFKLGRYATELTAEQARAEAKRLSAEIAFGRNPAAERKEARRERQARQGSPSVSDLWAAFSEAHSGAWSPNTARSYASWFNTHVAPEIGGGKAHEVQPSDIRRLYAVIVKRSPATAQQVLRTTSSMYSWAVAQDDLPLITVNPCTGAIANGSRGPGANKRERYPVGDELERLVAVLVALADLPAKFFTILLLSGCRKGELLHAKWADFDLEAAVWIKPASSTKQKRLHRLPLNPEAVAILREVRAMSPFAPFSRLNEHVLRDHWRAILEAAGIVDLHIHDLRHWHASVAASSGETLLMIGGLLGHADQRTTGRYAHLLDHSVRAASAKVGQVISLAGRKP
jgi:integrase